MADKPSDKNGRFDTGLIRELAAILREADLGEIEVEQNGTRIKVAKAEAKAVQMAYAPAPAAAPAAGAEWADAVRFDGAVVARADASEAAAFAANAARLGAKAQSISAGEFRKRTGFRSKVEHALFVEAEGTADPLRMLTGLAMQAHALGVLRFYDTDLWSVTATSASTHDGIVFEADAVVLAPGAWANDGMLKAAPALKQVRAGKGIVGAVEFEMPLRPNLRTGDFYLAQRREDAVIGSTLEFDKFDRKVDRAKLAALHAAAERRCRAK